ncbi:MAG: histidine ammonia-lyase [Saprospiraceae bacterium]
MAIAKKLLDKDWSIKDIVSIFQKKSKIEIDKSTENLVVRQRQKLEKLIKSKSEPIYGINTGFGSLCNTLVAPQDLEILQENLIKSHACGIGNPVTDETVRLILIFKILSLSKGNSAIRIELLQFLVDLYNKNGIAYIPEFGSLGASGDLAPLSHLSLCILGQGKMKSGDSWSNTKEVLAKKKLKPIGLKAKEGLALINGTQYSLALLFQAVVKARRCYHLSNLVSALSLEAFNGRLEAFDPAIQRLRNQSGQISCAQEFLDYFKTSNIQTRKKDAVQDPYSFRCIPQVHGASLDAIKYVEQIVQNEINSVTDNPLLIDDDLILSGGNFHAQALALAADFLSIAVSELGSISERRSYQLVSGNRGLPDFLAGNPGLESGYMIVQYAVASIASLNKSLATPSSVDSIISSKAQEDHVSMAPNASWKCLKILDNVEQILSIEWLIGARAIEFGRDIKLDKNLQSIFTKYRKIVAFQKSDHIPQELYAPTTQFLRTITCPVQ